MKISEVLKQDKPTLSFEVFPPKKDTDFAQVEAASTQIAALNPSYMSVTYGAGGSTKGLTIRLAEEIQKKYDVATIAHLTCVCASFMIWMPSLSLKLIPATSSNATQSHKPTKPTVFLPML